MPSIDPFASVTASVLELLARDGDLFLTLGTNLFRGLAVIVIAWFGIRAALGSAEGRTSFPFGRFVSLVVTIAFGYAMITFYRQPIPGIGLSFTQLLTDQPLYLAHQLEVTQVNASAIAWRSCTFTMEQPLVLNVTALVSYFCVALAVTAARATLLAVTGSASSPRAWPFWSGRCSSCSLSCRRWTGCSGAG
ncbi:MAG: hypothetical protein U0163_00290 [Gemmatimonadaceae bacterium]